MRKIKAIVFLLMILALGSCELNGTSPCDEERSTAAIIAEFPDSIKVGNTHHLDITYLLESECGEFERFDITAIGKSFKVEMITKYKGCNCTPELSEAHAFFDINIDYPGIYEYKFWQAEGDYDIRTVTIFE